MEKKYSLVFNPSQRIIDAVKIMKDDFKSKVDKNWYNSCNSAAHITIFEFKIEESQIEKFKQKVSKICNAFTPFQVDLDHFGFYENSGAFFIAPNEDSTNNLKLIMKKTQDALKSYNIQKSTDPHMSIGRKLTPENLKIASQLFTTIEMDFLCDNIVLREFDPVKKQFFVIHTFAFGSNPEPEFVQGSLF